MGRHGARGLCGKKAFNRQAFKRRLCAVCVNKAPAGVNVSSWIRKFSSGKEIARAPVNERYRISHIGRPCETTRKLRWRSQRCTYYEGDMLSCELFSI